MTIEAKYALADSEEGRPAPANPLAAPADPARQPAPSVRQLSRRTRILLYVLAGTVVVLALALGLGLGLGLRHESSSATAIGTTSSANPASLLRVQAQDSSAFVLRGSAMLSDPPQTRAYDFVLEERLGAPDGYEKTMLVVNGMYPGPTIEVNEGDRIVVNVTNKMTNATTLHWHGLYQRGTNFYDGTNAVTQCGIPPGQSLVYNSTLDGWSGTTWWHAHYATQYTDGLVGALIVHSANETVPAYDGELLVQMSDLYHRFSADLARQYLSSAGMTGAGDSGVTQGNEPVPDSGTINGIGQWSDPLSTPSYSNYTLSSNKTYRLRLSNTGSFASTRFSVDSHVLTVIEADGTPVVPYHVSGLVIEVGQRYSVLLTTNQTSGAYWMRSTVQEDAFTYTQPGSNGNILSVLRYGTTNDAMPNATLASASPGAGPGAPSDLSVTQLVPADAMIAPASTISYLMTVSMQQTIQGNWLSFINSTSWSPLAGAATLFEGLGNTSVGTSVPSGQLIVTIPEVQTVDMIINNYDDGNHPFHLHGHKVFVMGTGAGRYQGQTLNTTNPLRRDTVLLNAYSWTVLRFVADNPGYWVFHCHLVWHMAAGLLMQWATLPAQAALLPVPQLMLDQCSK